MMGIKSLNVVIEKISLELPEMSPLRPRLIYA